MECIVGGLQLRKGGMPLVAVLGKVFRLLYELLGGAVRLVPGELQLLSERIQLELGADLFQAK